MATDLFLLAREDAATFFRRGIRVVTTVMRGSDARSVVEGMREAHYRQLVNGFGVGTWDRYDVDAVHFVCFADGVPVASMRSSPDDVAGGETVAVFPSLGSHLPDGTAEYLYLSRQLVIPEFRRTGLSAVIAHAAVAWWRAHSALDYVVISSRKETVGSARAMGGAVLAGPVYLGPQKMPLLLMGARLSAVAERTEVLLSRLGWLASEP